MARLTTASALPAERDAAAAARSSGLRYLSDAQPGIRRQRCGKGFVYLNSRGRPIRDARTLARVRGLVIPPAWTDVWICPLPNGHIQAVGRDARGRKQYRYHPRWNKHRNSTKFNRMFQFGRSLHRIRRTIRRHLRLPGLPREKVLGTVIALLETTRLRIGNDAYAQQNNSFGLTTLRDRHADITGSTIRFRFRGKGGKEHEVRIIDRRLARIVRQCQDIPGQELFQYLDEDGRRRAIDSADVNNYLRDITGQDFTAKDFRTWSGTVLFIDAVRRLEPCRSKAHAKRTVAHLVRQVAAELGNTPAICRNYYIHPFALESSLDNSIHRLIDGICSQEKRNGRMATETLVMKLLEQLARKARAA